MVGVARFELVTSSSRTKRSTRLSYTPDAALDTQNIYSSQYKKREKIHGAKLAGLKRPLSAF